MSLNLLTFLVQTTVGVGFPDAEHDNLCKEIPCHCICKSLILSSLYNIKSAQPHGIPSGNCQMIGFAPDRWRNWNMKVSNWKNCMQDEEMQFSPFRLRENPWKSIQSWEKLTGMLIELQARVRIWRKRIGFFLPDDVGFQSISKFILTELLG